MAPLPALRPELRGRARRRSAADRRCARAITRITLPGRHRGRRPGRGRARERRPALARPPAAAGRQRARPCRIGYAPDPLEQVFVGEITGVEPRVPVGGVPTVTVVAHDFLQRLTIGTKDRAFALSLPCIGKFPLPDPSSPGSSASPNLLIPSIDPAGAALSFLTLLIAYAIDPLEAKRAIRIQQGAERLRLPVRAGEGERLGDVHRPHAGAAGLRPAVPVPRSRTTRRASTCTWGESLIEFTPRITTVGQVAGVATRIWVASIKMEFVIVLGWDYDRAAFDLQIYPGLRRPRRRSLGAEGAGTCCSRRGRAGDGAQDDPRRAAAAAEQPADRRAGATIGDPRIKAERGDQLRRARRRVRRAVPRHVGDAHDRRQRLPDRVRRAQGSLVRLDPGAEGRRRPRCASRGRRSAERSRDPRARQENMHASQRCSTRQPQRTRSREAAQDEHRHRHRREQLRPAHPGQGAGPHPVARPGGLGAADRDRRRLGPGLLPRPRIGRRGAGRARCDSDPADAYRPRRPVEHDASRRRSSRSRPTCRPSA